MAFLVTQGFERQGPFAIDETFALTKAQMKAINDDVMPAKYFTICQEDGKIYLYDKSMAVDANTGKFRVFEGGNGNVSPDVSWTDIKNLPDFKDVATTGDYNDLTNQPTTAAEVTQIKTDISGNTARIETLENAGYATEEYVDNKVAEINGMNILVVAELPTANIRTDVIYMVPSSDPQTNNLYEEYLRVNKGTATVPDMVWEKLGEAKIDLTGYATETYVDDAVADAGSGKLSEALPVTVTVGGYNQGDTIAKDTDLETIIKKILSKTYMPEYTAPSATVSCSGWATLAKVGATQPERNATVSFNKGAIKLQGVKKQDRAGDATGFSIALNGQTTEAYEVNGQANGSFSVPAFTRTTKGNVTLSGSVAHAAGPQPKDSAGADSGTPLAAGTVTATGLTCKFILPFYYGASPTRNITDFNGLAEKLEEKGTKTLEVTANNEYIVFAYDAAYGDLAAMFDPNNFNALSGYDPSTITVDGQSYKVYVAQVPSTCSKAAFKLQF